MKRWVLGIFFLSVSCFVMQAQETPVVSLSFGYIYLNADQHGAPRASLNGWYAIPQWHATKNLSVITEFTNFYGSPGGNGTNVHGYTAGPLYAFSTGTRITPFVFSEIGDVRVSTPGNVGNNFAFIAGVGVNIKLVKRVYLQLIPGDYVLTDPAAGVLHSYALQVGLAFDVWNR